MLVVADGGGERCLGPHHASKSTAGIKSSSTSSFLAFAAAMADLRLSINSKTICSRRSLITTFALAEDARLWT